MKLREIPAAECERICRQHGLRLGIGPFLFQIKTAIRHAARWIHSLYSDFELAEKGSFPDFHVELKRPSGLRRWIRPQAIFTFDGHVPFYPQPSKFAVPLFEWGLNWVVGNYTHQFLVVHAAVVERNGKAFVFTGGPGSGKSTLCAALVHRNWRLLSDELALIHADGSTVTPIPRPISLKNESIEVIRRFAPAAYIGPSFANTQKGTIAHVRPLPDWTARQSESARIDAVFFLKYLPGRSVEIEPVGRSRALLRLANHGHNYTILGPAGFEIAGLVVENCHSYCLTYSSLEEVTDALRSL